MIPESLVASPIAAPPAVALTLEVVLGMLSRTRKLFAGVALLFLYVVMSSAHAPEFDCAGWNGAADSRSRAAYFLTAMIFAALAVLGDWSSSREAR